MKTILTGDRPSGNLHLGHYFGSIKNRVLLQKDYETFIEIADVQALTDNFDNPEKVRNSTFELTLDYLACGIDPKEANIFIQSQIPEIAELTIFFSNLITVPRLMRNPTTKAEINQKKDKFGENGESITYGFLGYPVSQAADIAIFNADLVPVGDDQLPHIEQYREIIRKFNNIYGEVFHEAEPYLSNNTRVKGLDGNNKMSKSLGNAIYIKDTPEEVSKKVMGAVTDPNKIKKDDPANPDVCMVYYYHKLMENPNLENVCSECKNGSRGCVQCKKELIEKINEFLKPMQERRKYYEEKPELVKEILKDGTTKARNKAIETMKEVKTSMKINY